MTTPDHVALVVPRLEAALSRLEHLADRTGPIEEFPSEGTREVYIGEGAAKLLLLQPLGDDGPYARALAKRGPGLHHVALHVPDLDAFLAGVRGWLLHPVSVATIARSRTAWLARPGVPTLLEVHEAEPQADAAVVTAIEVPADLDGLAPRHVFSRSPDDDVWLTIGGVRSRATELAAGA